MSSDNDIVLSVKNVSKCFEMYEKPVHRLYQTLCAGKKKFYREFWALRDISFDVHRGECVGIIGRNGAGKSTLLQIITGTLAPTTGSVELKGRVAALLELGSGFNPEFTGRENVYLNGSILGLTREEIDARYDEILAFADIGEFIDQPVKTYSSGMLVRLAFAVQVMVDPDILIVDEALAVGDAAFQRKCYARMDALKNAGTTLLLVTHDTETVKQRCSRVLFLKNGRATDYGDAMSGVAAYMRYLFPQEFMQIGERIDSERQKEMKVDAGYVLERKDDFGGGQPWGVGGGRVTAIRIRGLKAPNVFETPGSMTVEVDAVWDVSTMSSRLCAEGYRPDLLVGIRFSDVRHIVLFETNNAIEHRRIDPFAAGSVTVSYEIEFPAVRPGPLFLTVALAVGDMQAMKQLYWVDTEIVIQVATDGLVTGFVGLPVRVDVK